MNIEILDRLKKLGESRVCLVNEAGKVGLQSVKRTRRRQAPDDRRNMLKEQLKGI